MYYYLTDAGWDCVHILLNLINVFVCLFVCLLILTFNYTLHLINADKLTFEISVAFNFKLSFINQNLLAPVFRY